LVVSVRDWTRTGVIHCLLLFLPHSGFVQPAAQPDRKTSVLLSVMGYKASNQLIQLLSYALLRQVS